MGYTLQCENEQCLQNSLTCFFQHPNAFLIYCNPFFFLGTVEHTLGLVSFQEMVAGIVEQGGAGGGPCPGDCEQSLSRSCTFSDN